jgi:ankyrin repeat protein
MVLMGRSGARMHRRTLLAMTGAGMIAAGVRHAEALVMSSPSIDQDLISAALSGETDHVRQLLEQGASVHAVDGDQCTALMRATHGNYPGIARLLIDAGSDVNALDDMHDSPYLFAGARGRNEILVMTLRHGADLTSTNRFGGTALIPACERGHVETVRILIEAGVDVDHVNNLGWTGLLEAIILSDGGPAHQEIVQLLIDAGANVNLADFDGVTPLRHAYARGYTIIAGMLEAAGAY